MACDVYPNANICEWMTQTFLKLQVVQLNTPVVLFWHYNLEGAYSDWWTDSEKSAFLAVVTCVKVLGIFVGHLHSSYSNLWNGIPVFSSAGSQYALGEIKNGQLSVSFV